MLREASLLIAAWCFPGRCNSSGGTDLSMDKGSGKDYIQRLRENHLFFHHLPNICADIVGEVPLLHFKLIKALGAFGYAPWFLHCQQRSESPYSDFTQT